jgi:hypothetical protein
MNQKRNAVGWFEIYVSDMPRAQAFYETVFQVKLTTLPMPEGGDEMEMLSFPFDTEKDLPGASGALVRMPGCDPGGSGTLIYFSCEDCAHEASRVPGAGGQIYKDKFSIGQYGFIAIVADTEGNTIGLHSMV